MANMHQKRQPYLLGIESSGFTCAVGLSTADKIVVEFTAHLKHIHSKRLAPFLDQALRTAGISVTELDALVLSAGPGSFTGLRIGYSVAKGLAHALQIPIIEVSTLDVWAFQAGEQNMAILPVIDAHREEVFCAIYYHKGKSLERHTEYSLVPVARLTDLVRQPVLIVGADALKLKEGLIAVLGDMAHFLSPAQIGPNIQALLSLGFQKYITQDFSDVESCEPMYMRAFKGVL